MSAVKAVGYCCCWGLNTFAAVLWSSDWFFIKGNKWGLLVRRVLWGILSRGWRRTFPPQAMQTCSFPSLSILFFFFFYRHLLALWALTLLPCAPAAALQTWKKSTLFPFRGARWVDLKAWREGKNVLSNVTCNMTPKHDQTSSNKTFWAFFYDTTIIFAPCWSRFNNRSLLLEKR